MRQNQRMPSVRCKVISTGRLLWINCLGTLDVRPREARMEHNPATGDDADRRQQKGRVPTCEYAEGSDLA
jgi:nucleoid DNA-binding protein